MGVSNSRLGDLTKNEYIQKFIGNEHISPNEPFWNRFLSFSFMPPITSTEHRILDESIQPICQQLFLNNVRTGNFGSLLHVFLIRATELQTSAQTENNMFCWQSYNALFLLRCFIKYLVENHKEEDLVRHLEVRPAKTEATQSNDEDFTSRLELLMDALPEIIINVPIRDFTYQLHLEAVNCLLVLLSVQMFSQSQASSLTVYRTLMMGKCSEKSNLLSKALLEHFAAQEKLPLSLQRNGAGGSFMFGLASEIWNILTWGMGQHAEAGRSGDSGSSATQHSETPPLASQSLLLLLCLVNHCTVTNAAVPNGLSNPYRAALFSLVDSASSQGECVIERTEENYARIVSSKKSNSQTTVDFGSLYNTLCATLSDDQTTLLLYLLIHRNPHFRTYLMARSDIEGLVVPILKTLYNAPDSNSHHIYMSLIILLILSEDDLFNKTVHETKLKGVVWYTERSISEISLGGLLVLVVIRTIQYNMLKMRDKYLHTNCLAALANMSGQFRSLHPYVSQRLVSLFETLAKKHIRLASMIQHQMKNKGSDGNGSVVLQIPDAEDEGSGKNEMISSDMDLNVLEEVLRMVLEILNCSLTTQLPHNPNLVYALLYKREIFEPFRNQPAFQDVIQNIESVIFYFSNKLEQLSTDLSVDEVLETIQKGATLWPKDRLKKFPDLKFKYVEEDQPEDFFIPYVWSLVCQSSGLHWDPSKVKLFSLENGTVSV
ncbi:dymeclin isoform X2 [Ischnura elegans]|uniref:dymeclin isoform X2 n=1 Tax=Ischnura elegans TaxID=197161 RepID=UPI001ED8A904|nr:dymeclin isoform X2 [Ischnura elegans]